MTVVRAFAALSFPALLIFSLHSHGAARADMPPAGFDCDKAAGVDERLICSHSRLREADADLARRYEALIRGSADSSYVATLRADEHGWLMLRNKECRITKATKLSDDNSGALADCFLDSYAERAADLDQMKANPGTDPATISAPIRKSLFSSSADRAALPPDAVADTGLFAESAEHPLMAWQPDGSLAVLGKGAESMSAALYLWRAGKPSELLAPRLKKNARIERVCARGAQVYLVGHDMSVLQITVASGVMREVAIAELPPDTVISCGLDPALRIVGDAAGAASLVLGPAPGADGQGVGLVRWRGPGGDHDVEPAIRIDHRYSWDAAYQNFAQRFVLAAGYWPAEMRAATERRWAKTNCQPYWLVSAKTGDASQQCIPYGDYIGPAPQPLPTAAGTYFAVHGVGLYRAGETGPQEIVTGPIDGASVSPDGCSIAFAGAPLKDGHPAVKIFNACKAR